MSRIKFWLVGASALSALCLALTGVSVAQEMGGKEMGGMGGMKMEKPMGKQVMITGEVRDTGCLVMRGLKGASHEECALMCAKKGVPLGIQADDGTYYVAIRPGHPADGANPILEKYVEKKVKVSGMANEANGQHVIAIMKVEPAS